jgi:peptidoglycan/xylan/chitin deacetylase (PgdA/CDA1 family)
VSESDENREQPWRPPGPDVDGSGAYGGGRAELRLQRRRVLATLGGITLVAGGAMTAGVMTGARASGAGSVADAASRRAHSLDGGATAAPPDVVAPPTPGPSAPAARAVLAPQYYVDGEGPSTIALTMDDGPHPVYTPQVLEILREYDIKATFNMIGQQVTENLSLVREVSAAGHTITNHTWNHPDMRDYTYAGTCSQIDRCNDALAEANQQPTIFRAPFGYWTPAVFEACATRNLRPVGWSVDPQDWDTEHVDTMDIVRTVLAETKPHSIILEHDGGGVRRNTVAAMSIFIPELLGRGYEFVPM